MYTSEPVQSVQVCVHGRVSYSRREARAADKKLSKSKVTQLQKITVWRNTEEIPCLRALEIEFHSDAAV